MQKRRCGRSNLELSVLGLGCWSFGGGDYWGEVSPGQVDAVVRRSYELGITYFDTAEVYNDGRSEESLGRAIEKLPRDKIIVGSKVSPSHCYRDTLIESCEASLRRLRTDYLDLYMIHWPIHPHSIRHFTDEESIITNPPVLSESIEALLLLQRQGKIRYIGVSNFGITRMKELDRFEVEIAVNQLPYNLLCRAIEHEALPFCIQSGIGVVGYMTLLQGILSDRYQSLADVPAQQRRTRHFDSRYNDLSRHGEHGAEGESAGALKAIRRIAEEVEMDTAEIALQWALAAKGITSSLIGTRNIERLEKNVLAADRALNREIKRKLDDATADIKKKLGPSFDYYESVENNRTR